MSAAQRAPSDIHEPPLAAPPGAGPDDGTSLRSLLRVVAPRPQAGWDGAPGHGASDQGEAASEAAREADPAALPPAGDWARLVERVQGAARRTRAIEAQAWEQDQRVQQLLDRVRGDMRDTLDRAQAAEVRLRDAQARAEADALIADARIRAAEERAEAAELRARAAETWLTRVHETVLAEFEGLSEPGMP